MYGLLFLTIYTLVYYFLVYKKTKHLNLTKETINMFKTDFPTSFYITVFYIVLLISLINYVFFTGLFSLSLVDSIGIILIILSGVIEYQGIIALKENYYPQTGKEKYLVTKGIYRNIRHPIYLSGVFLASGILILFSKNLFFYLFLVVILTIIYKVESEERYLDKRFPDFKKYKKTSKKLIPYIY